MQKLSMCMKFIDMRDWIKVKSSSIFQKYYELFSSKWPCIWFKCNKAIMCVIYRETRITKIRDFRDYSIDYIFDEKDHNYIPWLFWLYLLRCDWWQSCIFDLYIDWQVEVDKHKKHVIYLILKRSFIQNISVITVVFCCKQIYNSC
jgi:hypothetical protein